MTYTTGLPSSFMFTLHFFFFLSMFTYDLILACSNSFKMLIHLELFKCYNLIQSKVT